MATSSTTTDPMYKAPTDLTTQKITILLIEDDEDDVFLLRNTLTKTRFTDYEIIVSNCLRDIEKENIRTRDITLILLDLHLPDGSGVNCVQKVRDVFPDTAIIVLTGIDNENAAVECLREGAQNYLGKSDLQHTELERSIRFALERNNILLKLKQSEARFRCLIEHDNDDIVLTDDKGQLYRCPKPDNVLGWTSATVNNQSSNIMDFVFPNDRYILKAKYAEALMVPGKPVNASLRLKHSDGSIVWAEGTVTNMLDNQAVTAMVCNFRDITDRKIAEDEINKLNEDLENRVQERTMQLEAINNDLESFSYSVSHDLRSPINSISLIVQMLDGDEDMNLSEEVKEYVSLIGQCTDKMVTIIDALLAFARLGKKDIEKVPVNMEKIVRNTCEELVQGAAKPYELITHPLPEVKGDYQLLSQVWTNLISNAVKYSSKKDHPQIEIGAQTNDQEIVFYVKDNGAGFDMARAGKLFQTFERMHHDTEFKGIGVGLSLVQRIVNKHGGRIWADAKVGEGATFFFTIPDLGC